MVIISQNTIRQYFQIGDGQNGTTTEKGKALEDLICYLFGKVPGIEIVRRNVLNQFQTEETDVALWNNKSKEGFQFLPYQILVECKNWSVPVGSNEVSYFVNRLQNRGLDHGILIAVKGITGTNPGVTAAHYEVAMALPRGIRIIVITKDEILAFKDTKEVVRLVKEKLCDLVVSGTAILHT
jgi:hypothetical protein